MQLNFFILLILSLGSSLWCMPLTSFFPFGTMANDSTMPATVDNYEGPIALPFVFPFFDTNHREIFLGNNGLFSFVDGVSQFIPVSFPLNDGRQIIGGFWGDVDTMGQSTNITGVYNKVYYQVHTNTSSVVFARSSWYVQQYFPKERPFQAKMVITATWYRVGTFPSRTDSLNTFQIVLATDELRSFTFFHYHDIQWTYTNSTSTDVFNYAQAGFDAGDGVNFKMLPYSRTPDINKLVNASNVDVPGLFVFRIDTFDIEGGGCEGNVSADSAKYSYAPTRGNQLGATSINIQGPCFSTNDSIMCRFGSYGTVNGLVLNRFLARCVAPVAEYAGTVDLSISLDNGLSYRPLGPYHYMTTTLNFVADIHVRNTSNVPLNNLLSWGQTITLDWFMSPSTFDSLPSNSTVNIEYVEIDNDVDLTTTMTDAPLRVRQIIPLQTDVLSNAGHQSMGINFSQTKKKQRKASVLPLAIGFIRLTVSSAFALTTNLFIWKSEQADQSCSKWVSTQPDPTTWNKDLLPCPYTRTQATVAGCCYTMDPTCRLGGQCWLHQGRSQFQEENAVQCYRSRGTNAKNAGGECCYNTMGHLITRGTGAGSDDRYHSSNHIFKHFFDDVLPLVSCCKVSKDPEMCDKYIHYRPPRRGSDINPQNGGAWGDPHYQTLDGLSYTFNGYGEYTYLAVLEGDTSSPAFESNRNYTFMSQVRTVPLAGSGNHVTVTKAFAAKSNLPDSQVIRLVVSRREHLLVYRQDELLDLEPSIDSINPDQSIVLTFPDVTVEKEPVNGSITLTWPIGISVKIVPIRLLSPTSALVLNIGASVSSTFRGKTYGLLGNFDGDATNDLRSKNGQMIPSDSTTEQIHKQFGITWAIDWVKSMMLYEHNETALFYFQQNLNYTPVFSLPNLSNESLARQVCRIDAGSNETTWTVPQRTCLFDFAVTNDRAFALSSFVASQELEDIRESLRNPPAFNSSLPLEVNITKGMKFSVQFQAISEFTPTILYEMEKSPLGSTFNQATGVFEWQVPQTYSENRTLVRVRAQDSKYKLTSTHEILFYTKANATGNAMMMIPSFFYLLFALLFVLKTSHHG